MRFRSRFVSPSFSCLALSSAFLLASLVHGKAVWAQTAGPKIDASSQRSYPAGPYSTVSTAHGGLDTVIPLFSLEGANGSGLSFAIRHRSNQSQGSVWAVSNGGVGAGWSHTLQNEIGTAADVTETRANNAVGEWFTPVYSSLRVDYTRRPGTRSTLVLYRNGAGGNVNRGEVVSLGDRTRYIYDVPILPTNYSFLRLGAIEDTFGNRTQFQYQNLGGANLPTGATSAGGTRSFSLGYTAINGQNVINSVTLSTASGTRRWDMEFYTTGPLGRLRKIIYPAPSAGEPRPFIELTYTAEGNIQDLYDLKRNHWRYEYDINGTPRPNMLACKRVFKPVPDNPTLYDNRGVNSAIRFNWTLTNFSGGLPGEKTCEIYEPYGNVANPASRFRKHVYDNGGGNPPYFADPLRKIIDPYDSSTAQTYVERFDWNYGDATLARHVDRRGKQTTYTYDTAPANVNKGLTRTVTDALGWVTNYLWNDDLLVSEVIPTGTGLQSRTIYAYDATTRKRTRTVVDPPSDPNDPGYSRNPAIALTTNYTYIPAGQNGAGELSTTWTGTDSPVRYEDYDAYGNARAVKDAAGIATTFTFDAWNNQTTVTPPVPLGVTTFAYDQWNRRIQTTFPGNVLETVVYDGNSNVTRSVDGNGTWTNFAIDALNRTTATTRPVTTSDADNLVTTVGYDAAGRRTSVTNARGKTTLYFFNERDQVTQVQYPDGTTRSSQYDGNGNVDRVTNGRGQVTNLTYNDRNELTNVVRPNGDTVANLYRADGLRSQTTDYYASGGTSRTSTWLFDNARRPVSHYQPIPNKTVTYAYNAGGRLSDTGVGDIAWKYFYDGANRLRDIFENLGPNGTWGNNIGLEYHASGQLYLRHMPNSTNTFYDYDARGRTRYIGHWDWNDAGAYRTEQQNITYAYDNAGNVTTYQNVTKFFGKHKYSYYYDRAYRLTWETRQLNDNVSTEYNIGYAYDKNGNRTGVSRGGVYSGYSVDDNDKLSSGDSFALSAYDNDGNAGRVVTPNGNQMTFTYDPANRVRQLNQTSGANSTYWYNGDGTRVERVDYAPATGTVATRYVYDLAGNVIAEVNGSGVITRYHVPGIRFTEANGKRYYYRENGLGSQTALTGDKGSAPGQGDNANIASHTEYDAFGIERDLTPSTDKRGDFRFAGKHGYVTDTQSGMQLLGARYYLPALGRFLTQYPIGHAGGLNLYAYCSNNPLARVDPTGLADDIPNAAGRGLIRLVIDGFIPTKHAAGAPDNAFGDNRGFSSDSNGNFRVRHSVLLDPATGAYKYFADTGESSNPAGQKGKAGTGGLHTTVKRGGSGWFVNVKGSAAYPLNWFAPAIDYDITLYVTPQGTQVYGTHDRYPAFEVWRYGDGVAPSMKYGYMPGGNTVWGLGLSQIKTGK